MDYLSGKVLKELRERNKMTQKELADILCVSDKTISKWENQRGLPDISIVSELASALKVSVAELFAGEYIINTNQSANMRKTSFYVCPICGNVISSIGKGMYSCCGITLPVLEPEEINEKSMTQADGENEIVMHDFAIEKEDNEYFVTMNHPMEKDHYISFVAFVTMDCLQLVKLYPQQDINVRFHRKGRGYFYVCCNRHGLFRKLI